MWIGVVRPLRRRVGFARWRNSFKEHDHFAVLRVGEEVDGLREDGFEWEAEQALRAGTT